jgi:hypothetical protein
MKRILITTINGRFDELLIEYFISQHYNVRILAEFVDPGCAWLKWPLEIYSCSPHDMKELANAVRGCDFLIATHCNPTRGLRKRSARPVTMIPESLMPDFSRLKAIVYLKEGTGTGESAFAGKQHKCIRNTLSFINHQSPCSKPARNKKGVRSIFIDAVRAISYFENNQSEDNCFDILAGRIHELMTNGSNLESCRIHLKSDEKHISWMIIVRSWIETGLGRMLQLMRLPHNLTGL